MSRPFEQITIEQVARYPRPGTAIPGAIRFTPDGKRVTFLQSEEGSLVRSLWAYEVSTGERSLLIEPPRAAASGESISREEELRRERARLRELGVTEYSFARKAEPWALLVPLAGSLYVQRDGAELRLLPGTEGALDAKLSQDGSQVAFVRGDELWVTASDATAAPRQLTNGAGDGITNGVAEFIAQEELDRSDGFWWSQDGTRIAYIQADSRHIPIYPIVHQGKPGVDIEEHRYPFAGAANAALRLGVAEVVSGETRWLELPGDDIYIARVAWRPSGELMVAALSRDQRSVRWMEFDLDAGATRLFLEERSEPWLNLDHDTRFLESGETLISSERTGFRHLYIHDRTGEPVRMLTQGDWVVTRVVAVDESGRRVYFEGTADGPTERHLYTVPLDGGAAERVTHGAGWHSTAVSPDFTSFVDVHSSLAAAPVVTLRQLQGGGSVDLFANGGATAGELGLRPPRLLTFETHDEVLLHAAIYDPPAPIEGIPPLIVSVYGGPHAQRVADEWSLTVDLRAQYLAQLGYRVLKLDNRGSANRGLAFEAPLARAFGGVELDDHVEVLLTLARDGLADLRRVGIYGWSYGGYMTLMAMLRAPNIFQVGVAGAPVTDWDGYDTGYTERYMGTPQSDADAYRQSSVLTHVGSLRGKLLLVHGMIDENVHFRHTARLISALAEAQKPYDVLVFPEERHMPRDAKGMEYQERRVVDYFVTNLPILGRRSDDQVIPPNGRGA